MKRVVLLVALALLIALCVSQVHADRLIVIPTGITLNSGAVKAEAAWRSSDGDDIFVPKDADQINWLNIGISRFEIDARRLVRSDGMDKDTVGFEASILPETMLTPAIGIGVRDVSNELERGYYLAVSKTVPLTNKLPLPIHDVKIHGGLGLKGELEGLFIGAEAGLPMGLKISAELVDSKLNASLGWSPISKITLKGYSLDGEFFYGADAKIAF
jgi:hypothetical protein